MPSAALFIVFRRDLRQDGGGLRGTALDAGGGLAPRGLLPGQLQLGQLPHRRAEKERERNGKEAEKDERKGWER